MFVRNLASGLIFASFAAYSLPLPGSTETAPAALAVHDGTPVRLRLTRDLTSSNVKIGELICFQIMDDLRIDGILVMLHGTMVNGSVTQVEPKTRWGKGGKLGVTLDAVPSMNGDKLTIRAKEVRTSVPASGEPGSMIKPAEPSLLFSFGREDALQQDSAITVYIDGEFRLDPTKFLVDVAFTSNPQGARVSMYGSPVGLTPFTTRLAPGTYQAIFSASGFPDRTENLTVGPGRPNSVNAAFPSKP